MGTCPVLSSCRVSNSRVVVLPHGRIYNELPMNSCPSSARCRSSPHQAWVLWRPDLCIFELDHLSPMDDEYTHTRSHVRSCSSQKNGRWCSSDHLSSSWLLKESPILPKFFLLPLFRHFCKVWWWCIQSQNDARWQTQLHMHIPRTTSIRNWFYWNHGPLEPQQHKQQRE